MKKDYSITMFYCVKSLVLMSAAVYAAAIGLHDVDMLLCAGLLSMLAIPLFAFLESK